jgi:hypothetical protein
MARTKRQRKSRKITKKRGVAGKFNNKYFEKLEKKSKVVENMMSNLNNREDFMGFILELTCKYYKDLEIQDKKEVFKIIVEYLDTNEVKSIDKVSGDIVIGTISVARLLEINELFRDLSRIFVKKFGKSELKKKDKDLILKLADLTHPDDLIVRESFEKKDYYDPTIFNLFDDFIQHSVEKDINHIVLRRLFNMGFNVRRDYSSNRNNKIHRAEELKNVIEKGSIQLFKILVENGKRNTKVNYENCHMLNWAVFYDRLDVIKYLIEKENHNINEYCNNFDSFAPKPTDGSPLYNAVLKKNIKVIKYLIEKGGNVDTDSNGMDGETAVFAAVKLNNFEILKILVKAGANLDTQTEQGQLAYDEAVDLNNQEMIDYLLEHGARTEVNDDEVIPDFDPN